MRYSNIGELAEQVQQLRSVMMSTRAKDISNLPSPPLPVPQRSPSPYNQQADALSRSRDLSQSGELTDPPISPSMNEPAGVAPIDTCLGPSRRNVHAGSRSLGHIILHQAEIEKLFQM